MVTALEVFDSLQENIKKIKEGQFEANSNINEKNSGIKNSIRSNGNEKNKNGNKNSFIINENINSNIKININSNNIYIVMKIVNQIQKLKRKLLIIIKQAKKETLCQNK